MILITGQVPRAAMGTDAFQEAPVFNIMAPCAKHVFLVTDETKIEETMRRAFDIARSGRPGPVVVDVPKDVQNAMGVFKGSGLLPVRGYQERIDALAETQISAARPRRSSRCSARPSGRSSTSAAASSTARRRPSSAPSPSASASRS